MEKDTEYVWDHFQNSVQVCLNSLIIMYKKQHLLYCPLSFLGGRETLKQGKHCQTEVITFH